MLLVLQTLEDGLPVLLPHLSGKASLQETNWGPIGHLRGAQPPASLYFGLADVFLRCSLAGLVEVSLTPMRPNYGKCEFWRSQGFWSIKTANIQGETYICALDPDCFAVLEPCIYT